MKVQVLLIKLVNFKNKHPTVFVFVLQTKQAMVLIQIFLFAKLLFNHLLQLKVTNTA